MTRAALIMMASVLAAPAVFAATVQEDPIERRTLEIAKELRCTVCQNQPVSESNADLARDMRAIIREQVQAGKSRDEIVDYFVTRYGNYVLLKPPLDPLGAVLWIAPPLLLAVVALFGYRYLRKRVAPAPPTVPLSAEDRARVRQVRTERQS